MAARYTGCPFHRGDTRCRFAESFHGYKINLACKTEMGRWKRSRNRWRMGGTREEEKRRVEEKKEGEPRLESPRRFFLHPRRSLLTIQRFFFLRLLHTRAFVYVYRHVRTFRPFSPLYSSHGPSTPFSFSFRFLGERANLMLGACCPRDTVIYSRCLRLLPYLATTVSGHTI